MTTPQTTERKIIATPAGFSPPKTPPEAGSAWRRAQTFWKKNRGLAGSHDFWALMPRLLAFRARTALAPAEVLAQPEILFVATHHKAMTTYFHAVQKTLAFALNIRFERLANADLPRPGTRMFLSMQGKQDLKALGRYRGVHVMRDPRDMIVSGYHYHRWTHEPWVHRLDANGESYQQKLRRLDKTAGLYLEIDHFIFFYRATLEAWDMADPDLLEVSYEALMGPERDARYLAIFRHLGFTGDELDLAVRLMRLFAAESRSGRTGNGVAARSHLRSGRSRQWEAELEPAHLAYIEAELGPVLGKFGYG